MKRSWQQPDEEQGTVSVSPKSCASSINSCFPARLGQCEVCAANEARYSCPKCEVKTCSVPCVQIHKKELNCDGIRDRTKFIPLRKMTEMDFMNDYYFLEECTRFVEDRKGDNFKRFTRYNKELPTHLFRLRKAAAERGTNLRFLLQNFSRHKQNSTFYDWKQHKIYWRVEWIFANAGGLQYVDERCAEDVPLHLLLDKYVNPKCTELVPQKKALQYYQSAGVSGLKVLLKAEGVKRSRTRFYALDVLKSLKENFAGKTLVEFPCIYVSYEAQPSSFDVIDSDEDVEAETRKHQTNLDEEHRKRKAAMSARVVDGSTVEIEGELANDCDNEAKQALAVKRREERRRKRVEFEQAPSNYLFADEKLWDMFSSSSSEETENEEFIGRSKKNPTIAQASIIAES